MVGSLSRRPKGREGQVSQYSGAPSPSSQDVIESSDEVMRGSKDGLYVNSMPSRGKGAAEWLAMVVILLFGMWLIFRYQMRILPAPVSGEDAGLRAFSEERAYKHVESLSSFGPHPLGSDALGQAILYVLDQVTEVQQTADSEVKVEVDYFHASPGVTQLTGSFGDSTVYYELKHVVVRLHPKYEDSALENAILVSSHIDTVITSQGAGDCSSCVGVMLELTRALSHCAQGFKHSVIFLFNTGEEEGLLGAHGFMTQHPWRETIRAAVDLEAMGVGGKHWLFQGGPDAWLLEAYAKVAKWPATMMLAQDVFYSGMVKTTTDFQIFREIGGLTGLDFAYMENTAVYHTKNDKLELLRPGSLQHSGDNMLPFLQEVAISSELASRNMTYSTEYSNMNVVFWDILGWYMVTYSQDFAELLHHSIIFQLVILQVGHIYLSGILCLVASCLAFLTICFTWCFAIGFTLLVAILVPSLSSSAVPFLACPWLAIPLYCLPAAIGALVGHRFGHMLLVWYLRHIYEEQQKKIQSALEQVVLNAPDIALCEAERWLFKAGIVQWVLVLALATWAKAGSSYLALAWVVGPTIAYGLLEIPRSSRQALRKLRYLTFWLGVVAPAVLTALSAFQLPLVFIDMLVNFDRDPGDLPVWMGSIMIACICAVITTLMLVYLLPYVHRSGGFAYVLGVLGAILLLAFAAVAISIFPAFTSEVGRGVNVVHVIDTDGQNSGRSSTNSFLSLTSVTMGSLDAEAKHMGDADLVCNRNNTVDFVTHRVKYGCQKPIPLDESLWEDRPSLVVIKVKEDPFRVTTVRLSAGKASRWFLKVNSNKVSEFQLETTIDLKSPQQVLMTTTQTSGVDGWHLIQYSADSNGPSNFLLTLHWSQNATNFDASKLLKLRTDVDFTTPQAAKMQEDLPNWCFGFGMPSSPYVLTYLVSL